MLVTLDKTTGRSTRVTQVQPPSNIHTMDIGVATGTYYTMEPLGQLYELDPSTGERAYRGGPGISSMVGFALVDGVCRGRFEAYGTGCGGSGGHVPTLDAYGCFGAGARFTLRIDEEVREQKAKPGVESSRAGRGIPRPPVDRNLRLLSFSVPGSAWMSRAPGRILPMPIQEVSPSERGFATTFRRRRRPQRQGRGGRSSC